MNYPKLTRGGIAFFTFLICVTTLQAQDPLRKHSIGLSQTFVDYNVQLLNKELFVFDSSLSNFTRFSYQYKLSNWWMVNTGITNGFIDNQRIKEQFMQRAFVVGWDAALMLKLNNGKYLKKIR